MSKYEDIEGFFTKDSKAQQDIITDIYTEYLTICQARNYKTREVFQELDNLIESNEEKEEYEVAHIFKEIKESIKSSINYKKKIR